MAKQVTKKPTIREVAKLARVGLMTVSRVINDHPSVRISTRKKVESAIAQLGYRQNEAARLLKGYRSQMIGLIVPDLSDIFFATCAHTVQHIARAHGYMTLVVSSERDADLEFEQAELMANRQVSGLLIVTSSKPGDDRLRQLQSTGLTIVAFDRPLRGVATDAVLVDNRGGAEGAVEHLIQHGHRRIACIGYDEEVYTIYERVQGYKNKMQAHGLKPQIKLGLLTMEDVSRWLLDSLAGKNSPTAIFSLNHRTSIFLLKVIKEHRIRIPDDVALIGFDDFELASVVTPPLTTVVQPPVELARRAMGLLMSGIREAKTGSINSPAKIILQTNLIVRSSCGPHKAENT